MSTPTEPTTAPEFVVTRAPDRVPGFVIDAIVAHRNAIYRQNAAATVDARAALERAILGAMRAAWDGGETARRRRLAERMPTGDELTSWLVETAEAADNMADTYRESAAAGSQLHANDLAYWEQEARCARGLLERLVGCGEVPR
jgi:hypothetical protein